MSTTVTAGSSITSIGWSADAAYLHFIAGGDLYLTNALSATSTGQVLSTRVTLFAFQP